MIDFETDRKPDEGIRFLKGSNRKKFTRSVINLVFRGYAVIVLNIAIKTVPRIGKVVTYFAELRSLAVNCVE